MGVAEEAEYSIKPENVGPKYDYSDWPLLLKNYDKCANILYFSPSKSQVLIPRSACADGSLHAHSLRLRALEARSKILHLLRCHQP